MGLSQNSKMPKKNNVIANPRARWCGNPPDFQTSALENPGFYVYPGDCHTSDSVTGSQCNVTKLSQTAPLHSKLSYSGVFFRVFSKNT